MDTNYNVYTRFIVCITTNIKRYLLRNSCILSVHIYIRIDNQQCIMDCNFHLRKLKKPKNYVDKKNIQMCVILQS